MTKIMLVEDDKALREIYSIRLTAEGYSIVSASDGEEALALAVAERPDLIISDVMMPKISGFDMLDILRSTPETKDIKIIMMTALSSEEQRQRGENLGANKYLVKSQVGIEDVINAVHEVLGDKQVATIANNSQAAATQTQAPAATSSAPQAPVQNPAQGGGQMQASAPTPIASVMPNQVVSPVGAAEMRQSVATNTPAAATMSVAAPANPVTPAPNGIPVNPAQAMPVATNPVASPVTATGFTPVTAVTPAAPATPMSGQNPQPMPSTQPTQNPQSTQNPQPGQVPQTPQGAQMASAQTGTTGHISLVKNGVITPPPKPEASQGGMSMEERMAAELNGFSNGTEGQ